MFLAWVQVKPGSSFGTDPTRRVQVDAPVGRKPIRHSEQWVFGCRQEPRLPTGRQTDQATPGSGNQTKKNNKKLEHLEVDVNTSGLLSVFRLIDVYYYPIWILYYSSKDIFLSDLFQNIKQTDNSYNRLALVNKL